MFRRRINGPESISQSIASSDSIAVTSFYSARIELHKICFQWHIKFISSPKPLPLVPSVWQISDLMNVQRSKLCFKTSSL